MRKHDATTLLEDLQWVVLCIPAAEGDVAIETRGEVVAWVLGSIYKTCTGHL
jgi:hypothetical protein